MMSLEAIRNFNFSAERDDIVAQHGPRNELRLGDQDILNVYASRHPERILQMPCIFNFRMHEACRQGMPVILHGNRDMFTDSHSTFSHLHKLFRNIHVIYSLHGADADNI